MNSLLLAAAWTSLALAPSAEAGTPPDRTLWNSWYTVTVSKKVHTQYYNEKVELKKGRVFFQNSLWKKEEGFINEEQVGVFSEDNEDLSPLFYNYHSTYRTTEVSIDGTIAPPHLLTVRIRKGGQELPIVKRTLPSKAIFSQVFPVWLGRRLKTLKPQQSVSFLTVLEDNVDAGFSPVSGTARLEKPDDFASKSKTQKLSVDYGDTHSTWWVEPSGMAVRIELPGQHAVVERTTEKVAKEFLSSAD